MSKHTQTWRNDGLMIFAEDESAVAQVVPGDIARARLIASAPEPLDACHELLHLLKLHESGIGIEHFPEVQRAREAILKAEAQK